MAPTLELLLLELLELLLLELLLLELLLLELLLLELLLLELLLLELLLLELLLLELLSLTGKYTMMHHEDRHHVEVDAGFNLESTLAVLQTIYSQQFQANFHQDLELDNRF